METHKMKSIKEWAEDLEYICCDGTYSCPDMDSVKEIVKTIQKDGYIKGVKACIEAMRKIIPSQVISYDSKANAWIIEDAQFEMLQDAIAACQRLLEEEKDESR